MTAVVTGASGHIGVNLVRALLADGRRVRAVVHRTTAPLTGLDVELARADVLDPQALAEAFTGADVVFHLAGVISLAGDPDGRVHDVNVTGADTAAGAALRSGVGRFVHCSSIHAFDLRRAHGTIVETSPRVQAESTGHTAYDHSKADGERAVRSWIDRGLHAVVAHPTSVIGPHDHAPSRMGRVFLGLQQRTLPGLVAGAFDFVDVRDVAAGLIAASDRGAPGASYILGGHQATLRELAGLAARHTGVAAPRATAPMWLARVGAPIAARMAARSGTEPLYTPESLAALRIRATIDSGKAIRDLGYAARPLDETIRDIYEWFDAVAASGDHGPPDE